MSDKIREAQQKARTFARRSTTSSTAKAYVLGLCDLLDASLAQQPAPVAVPDDLRRDEAYRNGLMAGFGFGLKGDERGYATALAGYSREIHEARRELDAAPPAAEQPDTVKVSANFTEVADFLISIGWRDSADAQWKRLEEALPQLRALLDGGDKP